MSAAHSNTVWRRRRTFLRYPDIGLWQLSGADLGVFWWCEKRAEFENLRNDSGGCAENYYEGTRGEASSS
ncbi:MAG: hypothetical protein ACQEVA_03355, partial [Myxococcota bacterium]